METTTPFDLNQAIQRWRQNLAQSPAFQRENLDELEAHLRDSVATLQADGLSAEEALLIATRRLGRDNALATEFSKVNSRAVWFNRALWALLGIQFWYCAEVFASTLANGAVFSGLSSVSYDFNKGGMLLPVALLALANLIGFVAVIGLCWWVIRRYRELLQRRLNATLKTHGTLALTFLAALVLVGLAALLTVVTRYLPIYDFDQRTLGMYNLCGAYSSGFMTVIKAMTLIALTLHLARKQLSLGKA